MADEEPQQDPLTRGQFIWLASMGSAMGAVLTVPSVVYLLGPAIENRLEGRSDIPDGWTRLGSVFEVPEGEPKVYRVEFPQNQTYNYKSGEGKIAEATLVSWRDGSVPSILKDGGGGRTFSRQEAGELMDNLNVLSNACAHLGCPVRWAQDTKQIECPCHGGLYDINGSLVGGPPPKGLWRFVSEVREDGGIYIKHEFDGEPWVV